ncbi:hypothetical protein WR25_13150 [Diploscapter pachys]|uniref:Uncharacterized protein n=1 Tax=Diploscapter pachys TaxID=2018661 RepID=A0A2A2LPY7_9BILA|nr:hypothetical protein WR25_13150 [Diploscapter pachys]
MTQSNPCLLVENPLLCFIQNYRHLPDLGRTIQDFYSPNSVSKAKELLKQYTTSLNRLPLIWPDGILECYDLAINNRCRTRFACANLGQLPVVMKLGNDEAISPTFLLRELRDLRIFLAQALGCHSEEPTYSQQVIPNEEPMVVSDIFPKQQMTNSNSQTLNISVNNDNSFTSSDCSTSTDSKNSTPESPSETQCPIRRKRHRTLDETLEKLSEKKQMVETSQKLENGMPEDASILKSDPCPVSVNPDQSAPPSQKSAQIPILPLPSMSVNTSTRDYLNALNSVRPDLANFCTNLFNQM